MKPTLVAVHSRLEVEAHEYWTSYTGTKEDLIAAGVADGVTFPVWPKRVVCRDAIGPRSDEDYKVSYVNGGRFRLMRWHDRKKLDKKPASWDPAAFKRELSDNVELCRRLLGSDATGAYEAQSAGRKTHRLRDADLDRLLALLSEMDGVIDRAAVERCDGGSHLQLVK